MFNINWQSLSKEQFLNDYWQKKPVVLKNALANFKDVTDENELAGLAMEDFIDSRIVESTDGKWSLTHGPFENFSNWSSDKVWSLLVQGVDKYLPDVNELLTALQFIPKWRIDDVMVSYSLPNAGVGLHLDQYDVFIIQGKGKRRWQAGEVDKSQTQSLQTKDLLQLNNPDSFSPIVDEVLEAGDIIYIPPFSAHKGKTIEASLNYSIGFRAPNQQELLSALADYLIDNEIGLERFTNKTPYQEQDADVFIPNSDIEQLQSLLSKVINNPILFKEFCLSHFNLDDGDSCL